MSTTLITQGQMDVLHRYVIALGKLSAQRDDKDFGNEYEGNITHVSTSIRFMCASGLLDIDDMLIEKLTNAFVKAYKLERLKTDLGTEQSNWRACNTQNSWERKNITRTEAIKEARSNPYTIDENARTVWYSVMPCL